MDDEKEEKCRRSGEGVSKYVKSLYKRIVGAVSFSSQKIMESVVKSNDDDYNIFPLPIAANPHTLGDTVCPLIYKIWEHTLNNYHVIQLELQEFQAQDPSLVHSNSIFQVLDILKFSLAKFLSKFYVELHRFDLRGTSTPALLLLNINKYFLKLKSEVGVTHLGSLLFAPLPFELMQIESDYRLDHAELTEAVRVILSNLNELDQFLSLLLTNHHDRKIKSRQIKSRRWMFYTFGAVGISVLSVWLLRDSRLSGIINNWVLQTKDSTVQFWIDTIEPPLMIKRDGLLKTYMNRKSNKGVIGPECLQATSDLLHSMLLDFGKRTGLKFPPNASDHEMYNMVENRFEEQFRHPIRSLFMGELARSMLNIHLLMLNIEVEKTMYELESHMWLATQMNKCVILSLIPLGVGYVLFKQVTRRTKRIERIALAQRTQLLLNVEKYVNLSSYKRDDLDYANGLLLYSLDRLYREVKKHSKAHGGWYYWSIWNDLVFLGQPNAETKLKLKAISDFKSDFPFLFSLGSLDA